MRKLSIKRKSHHKPTEHRYINIRSLRREVLITSSKRRPWEGSYPSINSLLDKDKQTSWCKMRSVKSIVEHLTLEQTKKGWDLLNIIGWRYSQSKWHSGETNNCQAQPRSWKKTKCRCSLGRQRLQGITTLIRSNDQNIVSRDICSSSRKQETYQA